MKQKKIKVFDVSIDSPLYQLLKGKRTPRSVYNLGTVYRSKLLDFIFGIATMCHKWPCRMRIGSMPK